MGLKANSLFMQTNNWEINFLTKDGKEIKTDNEMYMLSSAELKMIREDLIAKKEYLEIQQLKNYIPILKKFNIPVRLAKDLQNISTQLVGQIELAQKREEEIRKAEEARRIEEARRQEEERKRAELTK